MRQSRRRSKILYKLAMEVKNRDIASLDVPILIVDDNPQYTFVLTKMLKSAFGYRNVTAVHSVEQAFELIEAEPERFCLLFIDYKFPSGMTGGDLLRRLCEQKLLKGKVAFLITSEPTVDNMNEALAAGASGVVAKPFDREALRNQLEKAKRASAFEGAESF